ncbi:MULTISPECIES: NtaA/DmoA family FMN-dependent monooxygenase [unclassified Microbacterium]|uniref:NtaA/DmoA family FMN-dependent monooxygenase n=1 Tax=unclassified Microbacterium TaxID=2609290 RepID=UPI001F0D073A|nr:MULTISPECIES: NtaA/DmoA family FMN-dependent monooxygenase [unclassified Microbacterium]
MSERDRPLVLSLFEMASPVHLSHGLWTHPLDQRHRVADIGFWRELGSLLEYGTFDELFLADVLGAYDVFDDGLGTAVREGFQIPALDPLIVLGALADATDHLGLVATFSTTYEPPFAFARRLATLDHLSKGRIGWNIVTSYLTNAARNFGLADQIEHDARYEIADEFLEVVYRLLLQSWDDDAITADRDRRVYAESDAVRYIDHVGSRFQVAGPSLTAPSSQRVPVLFQAGSSLRGLSFAAKHAEVVFVGGSTLDDIRANVDAIRAQAAEFGRDPDTISFLAGAHVVVAETEQAAREKAADYDRYRTPREALTQPARTPDLSRYEPTELVEDIIRREDHGYRLLIREWRPGQTVGELVAKAASSRKGIGGDWSIVGDPVQVATRLEQIADYAHLDGFNLSQDVSFESARDFIELAVPELRRRGLARSSYRDGETLRERLSRDRSGARPHPTHPAWQVSSPVR